MSLDIANNQYHIPRQNTNHTVIKITI